MNGLLTDQFEIAAVLERHVADLRETAAGSWSLGLSGRTGTARLEPDWLLLDIPLVELRSPTAVTENSLAAALSRVGRIGGLAKFGFDPSARRLHLQAEISLVPEEDPMDRIDLAFVSLEQALERIQAASELVTDRAPLDEQAIKGRCARWKELCDESGWPVHQRGQSRLAVSLDVPGSFCQAIVEADGPDRLRIRHEAGKNELTAVSRWALALFLLTASRVVRMVRAYAEGEVTSDECRVMRKDRSDASDANSELSVQNSSLSTPHSANPLSYGWEIVLSDPPALFEFDRALAALSMACRMSTNELAVLTDDEVSRRYLAVQGMVS